jgi:tetratricopeptide (TPR) repeat protein
MAAAHQGFTELCCRAGSGRWHDRGEHEIGRERLVWRAIMAAGLALGLVVGLFGGPVAAMGPANRSDLAPVEALIKEKRFDEALRALRDYTAANPADADGFSLRKTGRMDESKTAYDRALQLDPEHKGAHEYLGEWYLQMDRPAEAEALLAALTRICGTAGCEERDELAEAIATYRKGKN